MLRAATSDLSFGISPAALLLAAGDWVAHLASMPGQRAALAARWVDDVGRLARWTSRAPLDHAAGPWDVAPHDSRFRDPRWGDWPFNVYVQSFLCVEQWWHAATTGVRGVSAHHEKVVDFVARQFLDVWSPSNFPWTNPEVVDRTMRDGGLNFARGAANWFEDAASVLMGQPPPGASAFRVGEHVAITPGRVVLRNELIELIQYAPTTDKVHPEPILLVPAWIMKYYILDLSPKDSLVKYLVDQGHTVFAISWKNPDSGDRDLGMEDYFERGLMAAIDAVSSALPGSSIHVAGYCLGGTLTAIGAAAMARDGDHRLGSMTLFAAQTDFSEPGELALFVDESQVAFLEDVMARRGYLSGQQMAGAFQLLRSIDLIWSRAVREYLLGERPPMSDLMAWNADSTRMPARMHAEYLERLYLRNELSNGRYAARGRPVALADIRLPIFCVGTTTDHVAPWRSVYKLHLFTETEITFVLTTGGHNVGVVNPPGSPHRFWMRTRDGDGAYEPPEDFQRDAREIQGSWWPAWQDWLAARSGDPVAPPALGLPGKPVLEAAPGRYVRER